MKDVIIQDAERNDLVRIVSPSVYKSTRRRSPYLPIDLYEISIVNDDFVVGVLYSSQREKDIAYERFRHNGCIDLFVGGSVLGIHVHAKTKVAEGLLGGERELRMVSSEVTADEQFQLVHVMSERALLLHFAHSY